MGSTVNPYITLVELHDALLHTDPAAVLVGRRLLARLIRQYRGVPAQVLQVPHRKSLIIDRGALFRHLDQDDLDLDSDRLLPPTVILMARPAADHRTPLPRDSTLLKYWARLFHANVHLHLDSQLSQGELTREDIRARIEQIGTREFAEIRSVLHQEHYLAPGADDVEVYCEFAAVYLEMRYFHPHLPEVYFPGLRDPHVIDQFLSEDVDSLGLFARTRLDGAPDPALTVDMGADASDDRYQKLVRRAERLSQAGNVVRAALLRSRAAALAPAALTRSTRDEAVAELRQLVERLQPALKWSDAEARQWAQILPAFLDKADQGQWTAEARFLYDLQKICTDNEREIYSLDLIEWALSAGKRPIKRPLPGQRIVRITRHLRSAAQRLATARVAEDERKQLVGLLQTSLHKSEERLKGRFRPVLGDAFEDVGLRPTNPPERTAFHKMVEELLDRIAEYGFLTFSDLRDAVSRSNLKLRDLANPEEFLYGDPLLRLDRRLASALDGVYRPADFYLRMLERVTSLNFGTHSGRWLTWHVTIPFGAAFLLLETADLILYHCFEGPDGIGMPPLFGPASVLKGLFYPGKEGPPLTPWVAPTFFLLLGGLFLCLLYVRALRDRVRYAARQTYRTSRYVLVELPQRVLPLPALQQFVRSWAFQLLSNFVLKPLALTVLICWLWPYLFWSTPRQLILLCLAIVAVNSRFGRTTSENVGAGMFRFLEWLRSDLFQGLYRFFVRVFKRVVDSVESALYTVDELLRFRSGESVLSMVLRAVLGVLWFPVSYLARLYMVVLIEPGFNPVKAPVSILAAKLIYPTLLVGATAFLKESFGPPWFTWVVKVVVVATCWLLPDAFGFLFWETKENWKLYRANRSPNLRPVAVGHHGETVLQLLRPGFHSGTLPKLYARLRHAERVSHKTGVWRPVRACRESLDAVERAVRRLIERDILVLLHQSPHWPNEQLAVGRIVLASNQISIDLTHNDFPEVPLLLVFTEQAGRLLAAIEDVGWIPELTLAQRRDLVRAIAGLYKLASTYLVREQVTSCLPDGTVYEVTRLGLAAWPPPPDRGKAVYELDDAVGPLHPRRADGTDSPRLPVLAPARLVFAHDPITWQDWVESWSGGLETALDTALGPLLLAGDLPAREEAPEPTPTPASPPQPPPTAIALRESLAVNGPASKDASLEVAADVPAPPVDGPALS
jgi:hypothetical protein